MTETAEREAFEAWFTENDSRTTKARAVERNPSGTYRLIAAETAWGTWLARSRLDAERVAELEERERMRLAGIMTAAIGYWKEGDSIHPDYDTVALRDVAKLYVKYDTLYKLAGRAADLVERYFHDERCGICHLGMGDIRMTAGMQDDLVAAIRALSEQGHA